MNYSIIATTYNDGREIEEFLENILKQTELPYEIVIADGGSADDTIIKIKKFQEVSKIPIVLLYGKRLNIAEGYNEAVRNTTCRYIGITGVGNFYEKNYFECLSRHMQSDDTDVEYGQVCAYKYNRFTVGYEKAFLNRYTMPSNHGCLIKKEVFEKIGYFYTDYVYAGEDEEFFLRVVNSGYRCHLCKGCKVYWKVPQDYHELNKQINNYMIGSMQIYSARKYLWSIRYSIIFTISIVASFFCPWIFIATIFIFISFVIKCKDFFAAFLKYYYHIEKTLSLFRNIKYFQKKYKVGGKSIDRSEIEM